MTGPWNQSQLFSSASVEWATPDWLFEELDKEFGFLLDACASSENAQCPAYIDEKADCLTTEWGDLMEGGLVHRSVWMNPPWGRGIGAFVARAQQQSKRYGLVVVCLLPASTDTKWWHQYVMESAHVRFIQGRLHFVRDDGHTGPCTKGCAVVTFVPWGQSKPRFSTMGHPTRKSKTTLK